MRRGRLVADRYLLTALVVLIAGGVEAAGTDDASRLTDAVKRADVAAVRALLAERVDVNLAEPDGTTALHWAAYGGNAEIVRLLVAGGADVSRSNLYGVQPISLAATNGNAPVIKILLAGGADPNASRAEGETVLMTAARSGRVDAVDTLLEEGADVNAQESWRGQTALMWAAAEGHADVVERLLARGADVSARSRRGFTALLFGAREGRIAAVEALLDGGASLDESLPAPERGADATKPPEDRGLNAFLLAAGNAHFELAARLLERGADPNVAPRGWTALHQLSWVRKAGIAGSNDPAPEGSGAMDSLEFARRLVAHGADLNARVTRRPPVGVTALNMIGGTPFLLAARTADAEYMRLLVELGADPWLTNEDKTTALMVAAGVGAAAPGEDPGTEPEVLDAVRFMLELGADLNAVDNNGETAMHGAAYKHVPSVVRFLDEQGASIEVWNRENKHGWTPLEITQGIHRGMNIIRSPATEVVIREVMRRAGVADQHP